MVVGIYNWPCNQCLSLDTTLCD